MILQQYLADIAVGSRLEKYDACVFIRCAIVDVMEAAAIIAAQKMIDDGMVGFQEDDL